MRLGCKFEPPGNSADGAVAAVVLRLRDCVDTAAGMVEARRKVLFTLGLLSSVPASDPPSRWPVRFAAG
jgi:hypothetical protein